MNLPGSFSEAGPSTPTLSQQDDTHYPLVANGDKPSLREPPGADLAPPPRPTTLADFRRAEGSAARAAKLRALWTSLPRLPSPASVDTDQPTPTAKQKLPGQDTLTALSPERAERLRVLYEEELVRRCGENRPNAGLWGGADDMEPVDGVRDKSISWRAFRLVTGYCLPNEQKIPLGSGTSVVGHVPGAGSEWRWIGGRG